MMKPVYSLFILLLAAGIFSSCAPRKNSNVIAMDIPYPRPFPDSVALSFLPGVVSREGLDFNAAFSPDGRSFYFTRSHNSQWDIYVSRHDGAGWTEPQLTSFSDPKYSEADPVFSPDGKLYYISNRPKKPGDTISDFDIWKIEMLPNGLWTAPENFTAINSDSAEYYISFAANGNAYFGSARPGGFGDQDIYVSRFVNGQYLTPENLGPTINTKESEHDPCIWPNEEFMIFKSENRPDGFGQADLYCSRFTPGKQWTPAVNMGSQFNTTTYEYCPYLTPDGRYFFFSSEFDIKWISRDFVEGWVGGITHDIGGGQ